MKKLFLFLGLTFALSAVAYAQSSVTFTNSGMFNGAPVTVTTTIALSASCASTGVFDLSNTCNAVYFIGALK